MSTITHLIQTLRSDHNLVDDHEAFVSSRLRSSLGAHEYRVLENILIPSMGRVSTTQIDHIILSVYGIFVIETKAHSGSISGSYSDKKWTQYLNGYTYKLYNPFRQNNTHIKALKRIFRDHLKREMVSLVVFPSADHVDVDCAGNVGSVSHIIERIASFADVVYTLEELKAMIGLLATYRIEDSEAYQQHIQEVGSLVRTMHIT